MLERVEDKENYTEKTNNRDYLPFLKRLFKQNSFKTKKINQLDTQNG